MCSTACYIAPRIAELADKNLYVPGKLGDCPALSSLIGGSISRKLFEREFDDVVRLAASIQQGTATASLILRKLSAFDVAGTRPDSSRTAIGRTIMSAARTLIRSFNGAASIIAGKAKTSNSAISSSASAASQVARFTSNWKIARPAPRCLTAF